LYLSSFSGLTSAIIMTFVVTRLCAFAKAGFKFNLYWQHLNEIVKK